MIIWRVFLYPPRPIDVFVTYDGKRASDIAVSRYAVRHLVASEVQTLFEPHNNKVLSDHFSI